MGFAGRDDESDPDGRSWVRAGTVPPAAFDCFANRHRAVFMRVHINLHAVNFKVFGFGSGGYKEKSDTGENQVADSNHTQKLMYGARERT